MKSRVAALVLLSIGLGGCAVVQEKTFGESLDEASASSQIKALLLKESAGRFGQVDVEVTSRLVLLTGRVETEEDKVTADQIAWSVRTIDEVANEIEVMPKTKILENLNDEWITTKLRSRLVGDAEIKSVNYNIETFNGVVYLLGFARNQTELKRAAEHASLIKGVDRVVSYVKMRDRSLPPGYTAQSGPPAGYGNQPAPIQTAPSVSQYPTQQPQYSNDGQVGYIDPNPPQSAYGVDDSGLYGGANQSVPTQQPYYDPAQPAAQYDADGYLIVPESPNDASSGYADPYGDPFGDNGSSK
ncbi:BON domain-containing protein [Hirschia baltica]|uniref:Transport-associated n=1 Tax=Hirschia baltica (strain ATCC 49814 / DSM 5838 / IFAM 1418) TaxID=582402 RepID=C6XIG6_HIRBI|nr:BON domain-containing protein [Hirschia baltica]ACT60773.1 transport-associated [Hirschia baltica ATCC 49814]